MNAPQALPARHRASPRTASTAWMEAIAATAEIEKHPARLLCDLIQAQAEDRGDDPALLSERECLSFRGLSRRIDRYAAWAADRGLRKGDRVALMMGNCPEYVAIWLGLSKMGVVTALVNSRLVGQPLAHSLKVASPLHVIADAQFAPALSESIAGLSAGTQRPQLWWRDNESAQSVWPATDDGAALPARSPPTIDDPALLIFTSGTTGLPKAAKISHRRILNWALWFKGMLGNKPADRMYNCLPLYHSVGGVVAVAATLAAGGSTVIAEKFSAQNFWRDVCRWNCTQIQYIGELCRYLLAVEPQPGEVEHAVRVACGNGLRADIWHKFKQRFRIPRILEFYAATEGSFSLFNAQERPGSVGSIPAFLRHRFPTAIVKHDSETGQPLRDIEGFCVRAAVGEAGELIGKVAGEGAGRFDGYTDSEETERKLLRNVFKAGDLWFRTGDLMRIDGDGHFYFVDRIGDTFRWKGENVSTLEVANVLSHAKGVIDVAVYGVSVPHADGRAGMALINAGPDFDIETFHCHAAANLPAYAIPVFLRIGSAPSLTDTFKYKKQDLVRQGFDPSLVRDPMFLRLGARRYIALDGEFQRQIADGECML